MKEASSRLDLNSWHPDHEVQALPLSCYNRCFCYRRRRWHQTKGHESNWVFSYLVHILDTWCVVLKQVWSGPGLKKYLAGLTETFNLILSQTIFLSSFNQDRLIAKISARSRLAQDFPISDGANLIKHVLYLICLTVNEVQLSLFSNATLPW